MLGVSQLHPENRFFIVLQPVLGSPKLVLLKLGQSASFYKFAELQFRHPAKIGKLLKSLDQMEDGSVGFLKQLPHPRKNLKFLFMYLANPTKEQIDVMPKFFKVL